MTVPDELDRQLEQAIVARGEDRRKAIRSLTAGLKTAVGQGRTEQAASVLQQALLPGLDYNSLLAMYGVYQALCKVGTIPPAKVKFAVLGSFTTQPLRCFTELFLYAGGLVADVYEADYGVFRQEILDPDSGLYAFAPDIVFLATTWRDLSRRPDLGDDAKTVSQLVEAEFASWSQLWNQAHDALGCHVLQNNFEQPPWRVLGNHEMRHPSGLGHFIAELNRTFEEKAPPFVTIHDVDHLAGSAGRWRWADQRVYHYAKLPCGLQSLPDYSHSVASVVLASRGASKKCLVLDLDNTLWGGVIGDDGLGGIQLGQGSPKGEAFVGFQEYVKALAGRGVILAVSSKNEERIAREVFEKHPEMALKLEDIACFVANWDDKATNLRRIAQRLNIGLNSLVLVDESPVERSLVRQLVPEVSVPELPEDPSGFIEAVERHRYFQTVSLGRDDLKRTAFYRANAAREESQVAVGDVDAFLQSLEMRAVISPVCDLNIERCVQLINKTNQFNLTTRRHSVAEVMDRMKDPSWITRSFALSDRFGDNGLISVLLAKVNGDEMHIDTWVMSCRVFKRGMERFVMNHLLELAREHRVRRIRGEYIPTAKNELVRGLYPSLSFAKVSESEDGHTFWELAVTEDLPLLEVFIEEVPAEA